MAKLKYDGVIEAVRYKPEGNIDWVRVYLRRGPIFSDYVILQRQSLIDQIKQGKKFVIGKRILYCASTFEVSEQVRLFAKNGKSLLVVGEESADKDNLAGVPRV